jgi:hypothetical protein
MAKVTGPVPDGCHAEGCKSAAKRLDFCDEHFEHFKFGLIKKNGQQVPDYEKKLGHYQDYLASRKMKKSA